MKNKKKNSIYNKMSETIIPGKYTIGHQANIPICKLNGPIFTNPFIIMDADSPITESWTYDVHPNDNFLFVDQGSYSAGGTTVALGDVALRHNKNRVIHVFDLSGKGGATSEHIDVAYRPKLTESTMTSIYQTTNNNEYMIFFCDGRRWYNIDYSACTGITEKSF